MPSSSGDENLYRSVTTRNCDEMRQQTLDALKVIQSFEVKPARSARVQELLAQKTKIGQFAPRPASRPLPPKQASLRTSKPRTPVLAPELTSGKPNRKILQPVEKVSNTENRSVSSPNKVLSGAASSGHTHSRDKSSRQHEASPAKTSSAKRSKPMPSNQLALPAPTDPADTHTSGATNGRGMLSETSQVKKETEVSREATRSTLQSRSATLTREANMRPASARPTSSFNAASRLLRPTAASAAKMRHSREPPNMAAGRSDSLLRPGSSSVAGGAGNSQVRPSSYAQLRQISSVKNQARLNPAYPGFRQAPQSAGISNMNSIRTASSGLGAAAYANAARARLTPATATIGSSRRRMLQTSQGAPKPTTVNPQQLMLLREPEHLPQQPPRQLGKLPSLAAASLNPGGTNIGITPEASAHPSAPEGVSHDRSDQLEISPEQHKRELKELMARAATMTSTPVRDASEAAHEREVSTASASAHSFDFTNFSFEADWVNTPELREKVLEQKNVDTLGLFGHMPPINLERIFGAEMKRQGRR